MTAKRKPFRRRGGPKQINLSAIRDALLDSRQWTALGLVVQPADGSPYWKVVGDNADIMVELELQPTQEPVTARLAAGMWIVPNVGDEVAVILPAGELDFMPTITCILASSVPSTQGPQPGRIVIARGEVVVHDGAGGAAPLAFLSELQATVDWLKSQFTVAFDPVTKISLGHTHEVIVPGIPLPIVTGAIATVAIDPALGDPTFPPSDPTGTTVLKAK